MINKVSSALLHYKSIKRNALSLVKVLLKRPERGTILHFSGAIDPKTQNARLGCDKKLEKMALTIFLIFCMLLHIDNRRKVY